MVPFWRTFDGNQHHDIVIRTLPKKVLTQVKKIMFAKRVVFLIQKSNTQFQIRKTIMVSPFSQACAEPTWAHMGLHGSKMGPDRSLWALQGGPESVVERTDHVQEEMALLAKKCNRINSEWICLLGQVIVSRFGFDCQIC